MTDTEKGQLQETIKRLIQEAQVSIAEMEEMTKPVGPENSIGRVSRMDAINNKSVMESALRNKRSKLSKLKVALHAIDEDGFGICTNCGHPIQEGRLLYMPESTRCVRCASRR